MEKGILLLSALLLVFSGIDGQTSADSLFSEGNKAYTAGNFEEALTNYNSITSRGIESAELYLNLGNTYFKLRNYPKAILNYERALVIDPGNEKVQHNLAKAQMYTVDKINEIPQFLITGWLNHFIVFFRSNTWAVVSMLSFVLSILGLLAYFLSMKISMKRFGFYFGSILLFISLLTFYLAYKSRALILSGNGAVVMTPTITVKGEPNTSSTDLFIIHEGTKVYIMDVIGDWNEIKLSDGKTGWLHKKDIEPI
jgi:tetratricopeptide (TPR) repeat protein